MSPRAASGKGHYLALWMRSLLSLNLIDVRSRAAMPTRESDYLRDSLPDLSPDQMQDSEALPRGLAPRRSRFELASIRQIASLRKSTGISTWEALIAGLLFLQSAVLLSSTYVSTGVVGFPIDDGYIYSKYVQELWTGHPFQFNLGELSGGMTSLGWYLALSVVYAPIKLISSDPVGLVWAAFLGGFFCLLFATIVAYRLSILVTGSAAAGKLVTVLILMDAVLLWGAFSGLGVSFAALGVLTIAYVYVFERRRGRFMFTPYLAGIAPFIRPELLVVPLVIGLIFVAGIIGWPQKFLSYVPKYEPAKALRRFAIRSGPIILAFPFFYLATTGLPLPTSFYGKLHALTSVSVSQAKVLAHGVNLIDELGETILKLGALAAIGFIAVRMHQSRRRAWLVLGFLLGYACLKLIGGPCIGQMQRYLSPLDPLAGVAVGYIAFPLSMYLKPLVVSRSRLTAALMTLLAIAAIGISTYSLAQRDYMAQVRNISDGPVSLAKWISSNSPEGSVIAAEAIGAVGLFAERATVDIYGLTTPTMLGHYHDWEFTWDYLRQVGADYLIFYPRYFPGEVHPTWLHELRSVSIEDNRIAGDSIMEVYLIDWEQYGTQRNYQWCDAQANWKSDLWQ